jgi:hypothetical protein
MSEVHVHGVVSASEPIEAEGARRIVHRDVAALVSGAEAGELRAAQVLRAHWRVLEHVAARATVLPVRFGTVMEGDEAVVQEFLAPRHDELVAALADLAGKVQLTVKGFYDEEALLRGVVEGSPAVAHVRSRINGVPEAAAHYERIELGRMVAAEVERAREHDSALVIGRLEPLAVAASRETPAGAIDAVNAAFLVERSRIDEFSRAVGALGSELEGRITLRYVGPLPPYSFAGEDAWA